MKTSNNTYTTINPNSIQQVIYHPSVVTSDIIYHKKNSIKLFGKEFIISDAGYYLENDDTKSCYLGSTIECIDKLQKYYYTYDSNSDIYTIYRSAVIIVQFNNRSYPAYFYFKDNKEAEDVYNRYLTTFYNDSILIE